MSMLCRPPYIPHLYCEIGVNRGIHNFSYLISKTQNMHTRYNCLIKAILTCTHDICVEQNKKIIYKKNQLKMVIVTPTKIRSIFHRHVIVMKNKHSVEDTGSISEICPYNI